MDVLRPCDEHELAAQIKEAADRSSALEITGQGTRRVIGRPVAAAARLEVSALSGITAYEAEELVLTARAGTPLHLIKNALEERRQMLAFEPPDLSRHSGTMGEGTFGGMLCAGLSGPRRLKAGAARDFVLGFSAVSGRGETFKAGGRVVKNVTGYDLSKLMCGSWGTLAVLSEITIKVMPAPEIEATLVLPAKDHAAAQQLMGKALRSSADVSAAAFLPAGIGPEGMQGPAVLARLEGIDASVRARRQMLRSLGKEFGDAEIVEADASRSLWRALRDADLFGALGERLLWRISVPPKEGPEVMRRISRLIDVRYFCDWGGGLLWIAVPLAAHGHAETIRAAFAPCGGHAMLIHAPESVRNSVPVFEPQPRPLAELSRRVKQSFDPRGILNPSRMYAGV